MRSQKGGGNGYNILIKTFGADGERSFSVKTVMKEDDTIPCSWRYCFAERFLLSELTLTKMLYTSNILKVCFQSIFEEYLWYF